MPRPFLIAALVFVLTGCLAPEERVATPTACPVVDSRDWTAFVNAMPGPDAQPQLIVSGTVQLPSAGYGADLVPGALDRSAPPVQSVTVRTTPPAGVAATVISDHDLRLAMPALAASPGAPSPYRGVRVLCNGEELAFITPIEAAW